jgi:hypothetical protein
MHILQNIFFTVVDMHILFTLLNGCVYMKLIYSKYFSDVDMCILFTRHYKFTFYYYPILKYLYIYIIRIHIRVCI